MKRLIDTYDRDLDRLTPRPTSVDELRNRVTLDEAQIKWDGTLERRFLKGERLFIDDECLRLAHYRVFEKRLEPDPVSRTVSLC